MYAPPPTAHTPHPQGPQRVGVATAHSAAHTPSGSNALWTYICAYPIFAHDSDQVRTIGRTTTIKRRTPCRGQTGRRSTSISTLPVDELRVSDSVFRWVPLPSEAEALHRRFKPSETFGLERSGKPSRRPDEYRARTRAGLGPGCARNLLLAKVVHLGAARSEPALAPHDAVHGLAFASSGRRSKQNREGPAASCRSPLWPTCKRLTQS